MQQISKLLLCALIGALTAACGGGGSEEAQTSGSTVPETAATVAPSIATQPADQAVVVGASAVLSVVAGGDRLAYQWQRSADAGVTWINVVGANGTTYTLIIDASMNGVKYRVVVTNSLGNVVSSPITVNVTAAVTVPAITVDVAAQSVVEGGNAIFSVTASGTSPAYQWQSSADGRIWADISGATASTLTIRQAAIGDNGKQYRVTVSNSAGTVVSGSATLVVNATTAAPAVLTAPQAVSVKAPAAATFSVVGSGKPAPTYQWQKGTNAGASFADIAGATGAAYTIQATSLADSGSLYRVRISNSISSVLSDAVLLTVTAADVAPAITTQPAAVTVTAPFAATFSIAATGSPLPTYQWQSSADGNMWTNINSATGASYTTPATSTRDNGKRYRVVVTNSAGTLTSAAGGLTVNAAAASSVLVGRAWTAGKVVDAYSGTNAENAKVAIDDLGTATVVLLKSNGSRKVLYASRGIPGAAGTQPTWTAPVAIDTAGTSTFAYGPTFLYNPWYGVTAGPNGDAYVVWTTSRPCTASSSYTAGDCVYLVLAQYSAARAAWQPPVVMAENFGAAVPVFTANASGDFALSFTGFERVSSSPVARYAVVWRKGGTSTFNQKIFPATTASFDMDASGNLVVFGQLAQNATTDYVVYRGNVTTGFGAQEVLDSRLSAATAELGTFMGRNGHIFGFFSQNNGSSVRLYSVTAPNISAPFTVTDMNAFAPSSLPVRSFVSVLDSGDAVFRQDCSARRWSASAGTWSAASVTAGFCVIANLSFDIVAASPVGDALRLEWVSGLWATYDAAANRMVQSFPVNSSASTGPSFVYGVSTPLVIGSFPRWDYALSRSGVGVLVVLTARDVLPTAAAPSGDGRNEIYNVWSLFLK